MGGKGTTRGAAFLRPARQRERAREADGRLAKAMAGELSAEETAGFLRAAIGELMDTRGRAEATAIAAARRGGRGTSLAAAKRARAKGRAAPKPARPAAPTGTFDAAARARAEARIAGIAGATTNGGAK